MYHVHIHKRFWYLMSLCPNVLANLNIHFQTISNNEKTLLSVLKLLTSSFHHHVPYKLHSTLKSEKKISIKARWALHSLFLKPHKQFYFLSVRRQKGCAIRFVDAHRYNFAVTYLHPNPQRRGGPISLYYTR